MRPPCCVGRMRAALRARVDSVCRSGVSHASAPFCTLARPTPSRYAPCIAAFALRAPYRPISQLLHSMPRSHSNSCCLSAGTLQHEPVVMCRRARPNSRKH
eukprot:146314-Prymnesium_polylepis.1